MGYVVPGLEAQRVQRLQGGVAGVEDAGYNLLLVL